MKKPAPRPCGASKPVRSRLALGLNAFRPYLSYAFCDMLFRIAVAFAAISSVSVCSVCAEPIRLAHHPALSPDGSALAFSWRGDIWSVGIKGGNALRLTENPAVESMPAFSPDGKEIAFLSDRDRGNQVFVMPAGGGEAWPITGCANGIHNAVSAFEWSPDGQSIAFLTVPWDRELEERRRVKNDTRRWRVDYNFAHLYVVQVSAPGAQLSTAHALTSGRFHVFAFDWRPDGGQIAFLHRRDESFGG